MEEEIRKSRQHLDYFDDSSWNSTMSCDEIQAHAVFLLEQALNRCSSRKEEENKHHTSSGSSKTVFVQPHAQLSEVLVVDREGWSDRTPVFPSEVQISSVWKGLSGQIGLLPKHLDPLEKKRIIAEAKILYLEARLKEAKFALRRAEETFGAPVRRSSSTFPV